jgi:hypothetical protein
VIGLAAVIVVILVAVAVGLRFVRNDERADLAERPADRGGARSRKDPDWRSPGQQAPGQRAQPDRIAARQQGSARLRRSDRGHDEPADPREARGRAAAARRQDDRYAAAAQAAPGSSDRRDEPARGRPNQDDLPQLRARQVRGRRDDAADWPSTEWDKLSDADYWKEVASDRPLTTTARTAQPQSGRGGRGAPPQPAVPQPATAAPPQPAAAYGRDSLPVPVAGHGHHLPPQAAIGPAGPAGPLGYSRDLSASVGPAGHSRDLPAAAAPAGYSRDLPAPAGSGGYSRDLPAAAGTAGFAGYSRDLLAAPTAGLAPGPGRPDLARPAHPGAEADPGHPGMPLRQRPVAGVPDDNDPLTSPSFPKVVTSDSRSYRNGRSAGTARGPDSYSVPAQFAGHGAAAPGPAATGPAAAGSANGHTGNGHNGYYGVEPDTGQAATAAYSYRQAPQPAADSYTAGNYAAGHYAPASYQPAGHAAANGYVIPAGPYQPGSSAAARSAAGSTGPASSPPSGNPYGSYVSSDLPGYLDNPEPAYPRSSSEPGYASHPAGAENGRATSPYLYGSPVLNSAPQGDNWKSSWYPDAPLSTAPDAPPASPAPPTQADAHAAYRTPDHLNGNGHYGAPGYAPGSYPDRRHDPAGYLPAGYQAQPDVSGHPPGDSVTQRDPAGYRPGEFHARDDYGRQQRH